MKLVIDLGNTLSKLGLFDAENKLVHFSAFESLNPHVLTRFLSDQKDIRYAILCSVIKHDPRLERLLSEKSYFVLFNHKTPLPLKNLYQTPESLGRDRLAVAVGASVQYPGENVLAVDAGTCIKYDLVSSKGEYLGGAISPGIDMRFRALNNFTDNLPFLSLSNEFPFTGTNTTGSVLSGVLNGALLETDGFISRYREEYPGLKVVLTGGFVKFFEKHLKNSIFADPFLLMKGLNSVLEHNLHLKSLP